MTIEESERLQRAVLDAVTVARETWEGDRGYVVHIPREEWRAIVAAARPGVEDL